MIITPAPNYKFSRAPWIAWVLFLLSTLGVAWAVRHVWVISGVMTGRITGRSGDFAIVWAVAFVLFALQMILAWMEKPYVTTPRQDRALAKLKITVNVPLYNEEPGLVFNGLASMFNQSRQPDRIEIVNDGSTMDYTELKAECYRLANDYPHVEFSWVDTTNHGKRHAQLVTFREDDADIFITVDSDTLLDYRAIEEGIKPFADPEVQSVAGLYLGLNSTENFVTRIGELICVSWQLVGRSALSAVSSVIVNSGAFALYRADVIKDNADVYLNETFLGKHVPFSDDAHLAMLATARGKTVQQPTAASFTLYPTSFRQYCRQYTRWMRGAFIRAWWRLRHLPLTNFAFWNEFLSWVQFIIASVVFATLYFVWPVVDRRIWWMSIVIPLALGYVVCSRYLLVERNDMSRWESFKIFLLAPVMILWSWFVCRPIRLYAMATFNKRIWGTRPATNTTTSNVVVDDATMVLPRIEDAHTEVLPRITV